MGAKTVNMTIAYCVIATLSVLLLISYLLLAKKKEKRLRLLFVCVAVANCGYFLQSIAKSLVWAMWANRISYLGSAYLMLLMLCIVMDTCRIRRRKWMNITLFAISTAAFLLAAGGDFMGLYYKSVAIETINGMSRLVKEYGPLHTLYPIYLLSYVVMMIAAVCQGAKSGRLSSLQYTVFLATAVLLNVGVWAVEQITDIGFEFLSVSYIITEVMLLLIYGMLRNYGILQPGGSLVSVHALAERYTSGVPTGQLPPDMERMFSSFIEKAKTLSAAEMRILQYYIDGYETAEIPELAFVSIHTVKKHNRSIYQKLALASRDELMLYIELLRCCGRLDELQEPSDTNE